MKLLHRSRLFAPLFCGILTLFSCAPAQADTTVAAFTSANCVVTDANMQRVVYVNGIQNDRKNAQDTRDQIAKVLTSSLNHGANRRTFFVEYEWNPYGFDGTNLTMANVLPEDEAELFLQKTDEEMFLWNYRPDQLRSPNNAPVKPDVNAAVLLGGYGTNMLPGRTWQQFQDANPGFEITDYQFGDNTVQHRLSYANAVKPENIAPSQTVVANLVARTKCPGIASTIVVAHSQGNILASFAYAQLASDPNVDVNKVLRVVNIANTMSFSVNNLNMTHAADTVVSETLRDIATSNHMGTTGMNWWRYTQLCPKSETYYCPFAIDTPTLQAPPATLNSGQTLNDTCSTSICEHGVIGTYLNETEITTVSDKRGVVFTNDTQTFAKFFEDLVYAATISLDSANAPPPQPPSWSSYIDTNFSSDVPNMYTWGNSHFDSSAQAYVVAGTDGFGVGLPPDLSEIVITMHMMFIAGDNQPNQYGFGLWSTNPGVSDAVFIDFMHNAGVCGPTGNETFSMSGNPSPWQCQTNLGIDTQQIVNSGWFTLQAHYNRTKCTMSVQLTRDDNGYGKYFDVPLLGAQCSNARGSFIFTPGSPSGTALMLFNHMNVMTYK